MFMGEFSQIISFPSNCYEKYFLSLTSFPLQVTLCRCVVVKVFFFSGCWKIRKKSLPSLSKISALFATCVVEAIVVRMSDWQVKRSYSGLSILRTSLFRVWTHENYRGRFQINFHNHSFLMTLTDSQTKIGVMLRPDCKVNVEWSGWCSQWAVTDHFLATHNSCSGGFHDHQHPSRNSLLFCSDCTFFLIRNFFPFAISSM